MRGRKPDRPPVHRKPQRTRKRARKPHRKQGPARAQLVPPCQQADGRQLRQRKHPVDHQRKAEVQFRIGNPPGEIAKADQPRNHRQGQQNRRKLRPAPARKQPDPGKHQHAHQRQRALLQQRAALVDRMFLIRNPRTRNRIRDRDQRALHRRHQQDQAKPRGIKPKLRLRARPPDHDRSSHIGRGNHRLIDEGKHPPIPRQSHQPRPQSPTRQTQALPC